jgi:RimJ/RimL family protein N-acetyltransferase
MAALAREALTRGALRIEWAVLVWNARAISFYDRLGARRPHEWIKHTLEGKALATVAGNSK